MGGVVSEPPGAARAALMLLPGYGRPARSGVNGFWTRLSREFAARGLVVLRVDWSREGETLPLGEGVRGQARKSAYDALLFAQVLPWFKQRVGELDLLLAGSCAGARAAIELAGRDHPGAVARTFLIVPHFRVLEGAEQPARIVVPSREFEDPDVVDPLMVDCLRTILSRAPSWALLGERDNADISLLKEVVGPTEHELEVEVVPNAALHELDRPLLQEEASRRLIASVEQTLTELSAAAGSPGPRAPAKPG
jgi:hypothetical protein